MNTIDMNINCIGTSANFSWCTNELNIKGVTPLLPAHPYGYTPDPILIYETATWKASKILSITIKL